MLVYREAGAEVEARSVIARARAAEPLERLIELGALESAIADAKMPERDTIDTSGARAATLAAARAWLGSDDAATVEAALDRVDAPARVTMRVPEGFAYDALFPETYAFAARSIAKRARRVCVLGVRSIGATLSAIVAAALESEGCVVSSCTVRPHGDPFDRVLRLHEDLGEAWQREAAHGALFVIVDEGPRASGSSFAAVIDALEALAVPLDRIVIMPSWRAPASSLCSERARRVWSMVAKVHVDAEAIGITPERIFGVPCVDFSAGKWREHAGAWPAVQPQHERWKAFAPSERRVIKFVGLGRWGRAARARAEQLAEMGLGPRPCELRSGFLAMPWIEGRPLERCGNVATAARIGKYISRVARAFPAGEARNDALVEMVRTNLGESFGDVPAAFSHTLDAIAQTSVRACEIDGRMLAHEWIATTGGDLVKVDALDHHRDHFFPGAHAPEWDLAAAEIELAMTDAESSAMHRAFGDTTMMPFFRLAYAAFRVGYATLAKDALAGTDDGERFARSLRRYSQCALKAAACFTASSKSPRKRIARSSVNT